MRKKNRIDGSEGAEFSFPSSIMDGILIFVELLKRLKRWHDEDSVSAWARIFLLTKFILHSSIVIIFGERMKKTTTVKAIGSTINAGGTANHERITSSDD